MQTARENRLNRIFDEIGRGSSLALTLSLVAEQITADTGAPACKIWVVKRGDICDECPLASSCTNRQMCMHLTAASGADLDREYPRIPLSVLNASLIARGGVADFSDPRGAGEKLFGLQHAANGQSSDCYALHPLRGASGTVGLIGLFNHRPFREDELEALRDIAPAAAVAVRLAELQSRSDSLRARLEKEAATTSDMKHAGQEREAELEEAAAQLTHLVAQLQVERDSLVRAKQDAERQQAQLEEQNKRLREREEMLEATQRHSSQAASEMAYQVEGERRRLEEENEQLTAKVSALESHLSQLDSSRAALESEVSEITAEFERLKAEVESVASQLATADTAQKEAQEALGKLEARAITLMEENAGLVEQNATHEATIARLRDENTVIVDAANELERSLRIAEDARARLEQTRVGFEERISELSTEMERQRAEKDRASGENEQLVTEIERLREEISGLRSTGLSSGEDNSRLAKLNEELTEAQVLAEGRVVELEQLNQTLNKQLTDEREMSRARIAELEEQNASFAEKFSQLESEASLVISTAPEIENRLTELESRAAELEQENMALAEANAQMEAAINQFEQLSGRLEESALKLRARAEQAERARMEADQRNRVIIEQNRRLTLEAHAKARFLANMSHELRTPMNAIIGFTSLLADDRSLQLSERHRRSLERVSRNARDLLELINNVLDLSKIEAGRMEVYSEPADARDLIERAIGVAEPLKENRPIRLVAEIEDDLPEMRTDRTKLQQILINLLSNAIKFTSVGEVKVTAARAGDNHLRISVSDTGVGILESDIPKIFEEFRQVGPANRAASRGTGLGLTITSRLVELLGGEITVTSRVSEGSVFSVTLPIEIEGRAASTDAEMPLIDPDRTALVIDGDPASLFLTKKYLTEAGYSVAATDDGARGIEIAAKARPSVVTIALDLIEDSTNVIERIARGEESSEDEPCMVIAISSEAGLERQAIDAGASVFLRKPVERAHLISFVERASAGSARRVLAVDDDADALDLVVAMLEGSGYEIQTATSGRACVEEISRARPDAIILDLMLPEMDGFEVVHRLSLNDDWRTIPVILLTARDLSHEERRALDVGTVRIIQKGGFTRDELMAEIRVAMDGKAKRAV